MNIQILTKFPEKGERVSLNSHKLNCDFNLFTGERKGNSIEIMINFNIEGNVEDEKPGYVFDIGVMGKYLLKKRDLLEKSKESQYILYSALPPLINSLRIYIMNLTSFYPFGQYILPMVDLTRLISEKGKLPIHTS